MEFDDSLKKKVLYVGGIPDVCNEDLVKNIFITFGPIASVKIPMNYQEKKHRGFAFVEFQDEKDAEEALFNMNDSEIGGSHVKINFAMPEKNKSLSKPIWDTEEYAKDVLEKLKQGKAQVEMKEEDIKNLEDNDSKRLKLEKNDSYKYVYFEIEIGKKKAGRILFKLNYDICPKTVENFVSLANGHQVGTYKQCKFHRIIPDFMAQGGDFTRGDGTGGCSIHGTKFPDENFALKHDSRGILSMANSGPDSNSSQFFILFAKAPHLDNKHVVFGHMIQGDEVLDKIEAVGSGNGKPEEVVKIVNCGEVKA